VSDLFDGQLLRRAAADGKVTKGTMRDRGLGTPAELEVVLRDKWHLHLSLPDDALEVWAIECVFARQGIAHGGGPMSDQLPTLIVDATAADDVDEDGLDQLIRQLRSELLDLNVPLDAVELATEVAEVPGSKGVGGLATLGVLLVRFISRADVLAGVVGAVRDWLQRGRPGTVRMTIAGDTVEISGRLSADQSRLLDLWIARHTQVN
jgi:hypothetical protein